MPAARLPPDEEDRLAALAAMHVMDSGPDAHLDSFVKLAADLFATPIALVSLLDDRRQWFKARSGLDVRQTPRDFAFCAHAILNPEDVMVVEDAWADPRFAGNPLVTSDPHMRFYAGAAVRSPDGQPLGTLCVIDRAPRTMNAEGRARLQTMAAGVSTLLNLHRMATVLQRAATHDALTGVANRALFDHRLSQAVTSALQGRSCALLLLDLDGFKRVNDRLGHMAGDQLLQHVAARLRAVARDTDLVARLGGDEFAIVLGDPASRSVIQAMCDQITEDLLTPMLLEGQPIVARASIGVAHCPADAQEPANLLRAADHALYRAKHAGRAQALRAAG